MHTQGHIHRGNIHMKEQPHKETYTRKRYRTEGTYTRKGHTRRRDMNMEGTYIWRGHTRRGTYTWKRHEHVGDTHMEGTHTGRGHTHYVERTRTWRESAHEESYTRRNIHMVEHTLGEEMHMKGYTRGGKQKQRNIPTEGHTHGISYTGRDI